MSISSRAVHVHMFQLAFLYQHDIPLVTICLLMSRAMENQAIAFLSAAHFVDLLVISRKSLEPTQRYLILMVRTSYLGIRHFFTVPITKMYFNCRTTFAIKIILTLDLGKHIVNQISNNQLFSCNLRQATCI